MTEGNTCYRGGKPGVSDVFAASLWAADYLLELASLGYAGVNLHGGDGQMVANSLGGLGMGTVLSKGARRSPRLVDRVRSHRDHAAIVRAATMR